MNKKGTLSAQMIRDMFPVYIAENLRELVNQASVDLRTTGEMYRVGSVFVPHRGESIRDVLKLIKKWKVGTNEPLMRGETYLVKLEGFTKMPQSIYGYANPKSSTGRIDTHVRMLADGVPGYDEIPRGWSGEKWLLIQPQSFHLLVKPGMRFNQLRLFNEDTRFTTQSEIEVATEGHKLLWHPNTHEPMLHDEVVMTHNDGSLLLTIDLESQMIGFEAKKTPTPLDLTRMDNDPKEFFTAIEKPSDGVLCVKRDSFYILSTHEAVRVPTCLSCEMTPMNHRMGEFRAHYAGFIDPGWGYGKSGEGRGRQLTLELRSWEQNLMFRKGDVIAKIQFERMCEVAPSYDDEGSNYTAQQGPTLGKFFAPWE